MTNILVIDDEPAICTSLSFALEDTYHVVATTDPYEGFKILDKDDIDLVLLDWRLGSKDGIEILKEIKQRHAATLVILMTAYGTIESSIKAMKEGAYYYITKPLNIEELHRLIQQSLEFNSIAQHLKANDTVSYYQPKKLIGKSGAIDEVIRLIEKVKDIDSNILITGESGTGKEIVARAIHQDGNRTEGPFEIVNCATLPDHLLESELFGHKKGTFTGAVQDKIGKFISADGGTIFLDEIGELPISLQSKLLRVIQEREVMPLGSNKTVRVDFRLIAATNRDLLMMVKKGQFREDLYFRLNVIPIKLPPLRERKDDLLLLVNHFLMIYSQKFNKVIKGISQKAKEAIYNYEFPGNVRELANIMEHAVALSQTDILKVSDFPPLFDNDVNNAQDLIQEETGIIEIPIGKKLKDIEQSVILHTLEFCHGHRKNTAAVLGISERNLRNKLKLYGHARS